MVDAISGIPYSYFNVLNPPSSTAGTSTDTPKFPTVDTSNIANLLNGDSKASNGSLLDVAGIQLSPSVVSLLQSVNGTYDNSDNSTSSLLGTTGLSNGTYIDMLLGNSKGLPSSVYAELLTTAYKATAQSNVNKAADVDPLQAILASYQNAVSTPVDTQS